MKSATLGTLLRHLIEQLDGAVADAYSLNAPGYRPRFTPVVRALLREGPSPIKAIAASTGVSHSAISQTVSEMVRVQLVALKEGSDHRERIVDLTTKARQLIPILEAQWNCTERAARSIDADIGLPLAEVVRSAIAALDSKPFADRIAEAQQAGRIINDDGAGDELGGGHGCDTVCGASRSHCRGEELFSDDFDVAG